MPRRAKRSRAPQLALELGKTPKPKLAHGGRRSGAGRKPKGKRAGVAHRSREVNRRFPMHITVKTCRAAGYLPNAKRYAAIRRSLVRMCRKPGFRVVHFSVERDHLHFIVEAISRDALHRGMTGLLTSLARGLNRLAKRRGQVFPDRFHSRAMKTPRHVRNTLVYVLQNGKKHGRHRREGQRRSAPTLCSSARYFDGWKERWVRPPPDDPPRPVVPAGTWLLREGWKRHGLIGVGERPGGSGECEVGSQVHG